MKGLSLVRYRISSSLLCLLVVWLAISQGVLAAGSGPSDQKAHLAAAHAKWGIIKVIFDGLGKARFRGSNASRAALSYRTRQVSAIAAPALNKWVIRPEGKYLGKEVAAALDRLHSQLETLDLAVEFGNSPDPKVWQEGAARIDAQIASGAAQIAALFKKVPRPRVALPSELQREVIRDEISIIGALLANQDKDHRWTPGQTKEAPPDPAEVARVATLHAQVLDIAADMIEYVLCHRQALPPEAVKKLTEAHARLTHDRDVSLRVIAKGNFDWEKMHQAFHQAFDQVWLLVDRARGAL